MFNVEVICDSTAPSLKRCVTLELTYWRGIHSEVLTHRDRARNAGSSRAIPWPAMCERIQTDPFVPIVFGAEQRGMQTGPILKGEEDAEARRIWLSARDSALKHAHALHDLGVHKSLCNRITEPWMWITVVMTATEWKNFFRLRAHKDAEIHFQQLAIEIKQKIIESTPNKLRAGEWHLPYVGPEDWAEVLPSGFKPQVEIPMELKNEIDGPVDILKRVSTARCARVSIVQHGEKRRSILADLKLYSTLKSGSGFGHWSPMEHPCMAMSTDIHSGPFVGYRQFRKEFPVENEIG